MSSLCWSSLSSPTSSFTTDSLSMVHRWAKWANPDIESTTPCLTMSCNDYWICVLLKSWILLDINLCRLSMILKVLFYYRLPEEEQALQKNPMCWAFPRLGRVFFGNHEDILNLQNLGQFFIGIGVKIQFMHFQRHATTGDGDQEECKRTSMQSAF